LRRTDRRAQAHQIAAIEGRATASTTQLPSHPQGATARWRISDLVGAIAGLLVLFGCALVVRNGRVGPAELRVFRWINGLSDGLTPAMRAAQFLGVLAVGPIVAVGALLLRRWRLALAAILVTAGKLVAERIVWDFVQRSRPGTSIADAIVRGGSPTHGVSFVSGHVVLVTGLAWIVTPYLRSAWRWVPWAVVLLVAFARVYLGAHAPLDVAGALALGSVVGGLANLIIGPPAAWPGSTRGSDPKEGRGRRSSPADTDRRRRERGDALRPGDRTDG
jgi:membrane-associated phospholipid phosphatase